MKKIMYKAFLFVLVLGMVFSQTNTAFASPTANDYLPSTKTRYSKVNLKIRTSGNFYYKGNVDLTFITKGEHVSIEEFKIDDPYWNWDDNYTISIEDRIGRRIMRKRFLAGNSVAGDLLGLFATINSQKQIKVGHTIKFSSYWDNTIKPQHGANRNLYLAKPLGRKSYSFVFTNEGLVEEAKNLLGFNNQNSSYLYLPINLSGFPTMYERLYVNVDRAGNVTFKKNKPQNRIQVGRDVADYSTTGYMIYGNTANAKMASTLKVQSKKGYHVEWYYSNIMFSTKNITNYLNARKLKLGDTISFYFERFDLHPRLGKNLNTRSEGYYSFQKGETKVKLTRYGFLTSDGYLVKYSDYV